MASDPTPEELAKSIKISPELFDEIQPDPMSIVLDRFRKKSAEAFRDNPNNPEPEPFVINPDSYGAEGRKLYDALQERTSEIIGKHVDEMLEKSKTDPDSLPWLDKPLIAEEIGVWTPFPQIEVDRYTLSKEDYDAKYPTPTYTITRRQQLTYEVRKIRTRLGQWLGTFLSGQKLLTEEDWENERDPYDEY